MSHHKCCFVFCLALFLITFHSLSIAQETGFAMKGVTELGGTISYASYMPVSNSHTGDATSIFSLAPQIGYFVVDGFEIGFSPGVSFLLFPPGVTSLSGSGSSASTAVQLWLTAGYNFQTGGKTVFPFLELQGGYTSSDDWLFGSNKASGFSYGFKGGIKVVAVEHLLINIAAQYNLITLDPSGATERTGFNYLTIGVGVGGFFK
jgi:hypothetical protein